MELLPTLLLPNSSIISSDTHVLAVFWNELQRDMTLVQNYLYRCPSPAGSSQPLSGEEISSSRRWLAKRRENEDELFGVQGLGPLLDADFERIHASLSRCPGVTL